MNKLLSAILIITLFSCNKSKSILESDSRKNQATIVKEKNFDITTFKNKSAYTPKKEDISPEGFNWIHYDFAQFFSGAFYEHNFEGKYREAELIRKHPQLTSYLESLAKINKKDFERWEVKHRIPFLINTYHAGLINLMIKKNFNHLNQDCYQIADVIEAFGRSYSLEQFVKQEIIPLVKDHQFYKLAFSLKCFEKNCPEFRNTIYNYKNYESLISTSFARYFLDGSKEVHKKDQFFFPHIQNLFLKSIPKIELKLKDDLTMLQKEVASVKFSN